MLIINKYLYEFLNIYLRLYTGCLFIYTYIHGIFNKRFSNINSYGHTDDHLEEDTVENLKENTD